MTGRVAFETLATAMTTHSKTGGFTLNKFSIQECINRIISPRFSISFNRSSGELNSTDLLNKKQKQNMKICNAPLSLSNPLKPIPS